VFYAVNHHQSFRCICAPLQAELEVDSDTPGTSTGNLVRANQSPVSHNKYKSSAVLPVVVDILFSLPGSQPEFQEAWCGFGCEILAWAMQRAIASNDGVARLRAVQAARGPL